MEAKTSPNRGTPNNSPRASSLTQFRMIVVSVTCATLVSVVNNIIMPNDRLSSSGNRSHDTPQKYPKTSKKLTKDQHINTFWWPSPEEYGGILGKIHDFQNPSDCSAASAKFFVWRSKSDNENDTRGLTAWAHAASSHMLHALTDADQPEAGHRILINDDKLFPMAKGCEHGLETRECYFEPLTNCKLSDVDDYETADPKSSNIKILSKTDEEYDRNVRTLYTSDSIWFRKVKDMYSWTGLGFNSQHSTIHMTAACLAYYFRVKPWLRKEIDERLRRNIPLDLNPQRTIGVPIRRSDKCHGHALEGSASGELECPPLEEYLKKVKEFLEFDPRIENVIVTSEDKSACEEFLEILNKELPSLRVIQNIGDVQQGTGSGSKLEAYTEGSSNAQVVASALTSLHMHMRARYFVLTSKSTWTSTIAVMARVYGFASEVIVFDIGPNKNTFAHLARRGCA
mmetsp:Transcript_5308/g.9887  ORF Transcript_5308/g.9887 Transcript_5308/m.9887 type:complete len:455 (+) Transcript_5308:193-1557(+)